MSVIGQQGAGMERQALETLVAKLTAIENDPSFNGIWGFLHAHGYTYTGPDWRDDLASARTVLAMTAPKPARNSNPS